MDLSVRIAKLIPANHRVVVLGKTGSGKSILAQAYLAGYRNVIALDTKRGTDKGINHFWPRAAAVGHIPVFSRLADVMKFGEGKAVWCPERSEKDFDVYDRFFEWILTRGNTVVWVDEVYDVTDGQEIPRGYRACITEGRSLGVGVWSCSQRPMKVPNVIFSEAEHFFVFRLRLGGDRKKVAEWAGEEVLENPTGKWGFWYYDDDLERPVLKNGGLKFHGEGV